MGRLPASTYLPGRNRRRRAPSTPTVSPSGTALTQIPFSLWALEPFLLGDSVTFRSRRLPPPRVGCVSTCYRTLPLGHHSTRCLFHPSAFCIAPAVACHAPCLNYRLPVCVTDHWAFTTTVPGVLPAFPTACRFIPPLLHQVLPGRAYMLHLHRTTRWAPARTPPCDYHRTIHHALPTYRPFGPTTDR